MYCSADIIVSTRFLLMKFLRTSLIVLGLAIPTIFYAYQDENHPCQDKERLFTMSMTLKIIAFSSITVSGIQFLTLLYVNIVKGKIHILKRLLILYNIDMFLFLALWVNGLISIARSRKCLRQGVGMAIMTLIQLVFGGLRFSFMDGLNIIGSDGVVE